jgi:uncharacterized repeat protein (TIGR01451 family)
VAHSDARSVRLLDSVRPEPSYGGSEVQHGMMTEIQKNLAICVRIAAGARSSSWHIAHHGVARGLRGATNTAIGSSALLGRRRLDGCLLRRMSRGLATGFLAVMLLIGLGVERAAAQETAADLQITKAASSKTVRVGETVTYTVTLTNLGPGVATGVVFGDPLPDQLNLVESTCGVVSAFCTVEGLPSGASETLTIVATPITNLARNERRISNTAFIANFGTTSDPNPSNDQASTIVRVVGPR